MDAHIIQEIQREGAEALLNVGVSLPLKDFKVPFRKEPLHLRLTMKRPTMARQIQIARTWLSVGMTLEEFTDLILEKCPDAITAYNFDGGGSTNLMLNGKRVHKTLNSRSISGLIYFVSAVVGE